MALLAPHQRYEKTQTYLFGIDVTSFLVFHTEVKVFIRNKLNIDIRVKNLRYEHLSDLIQHQNGEWT